MTAILQLADALGHDINFYRNEYYKRGECIEKLKAQITNYKAIIAQKHDKTKLASQYKDLQYKYKMLSIRHERMFLKFTHGTGISEVEGTSKNVSDIINGVCVYYGVTADEVIGKSRKTEIVRARHTIFYIFCEKFLGLKHIGRLIGGRDHSTVIHGRDSISDKINLGLIEGKELEMINRFIKSEI